MPEAGEARGRRPRPNAAFQRVVAAFAEHRDVTHGRLMASTGLKVNGRIFAMYSRGRFVAKLPRGPWPGLSGDR